MNREKPPNLSIPHITIDTNLLQTAPPVFFPEVQHRQTPAVVHNHGSLKGKDRDPLLHWEL
jgi:hypothetical protein